MDQSFPIHTAQVECQDCYKCVRECPAKAIKVNNGHASIVPELCTSCGHCVVICPVKAKKVRNDQTRAERLLEKNDNVYVSLAPSWIIEFPGITASQITTAIKQLGFAGVSETALGAQEISTALNEILTDSQNKLYISSACPSVLEFISKYLPKYQDNVCNLLSPLLSHTQLLKKHYGDSTRIVFVGPCIAKKLEADRYPEKLSLSLSFMDIKEMFERHGINPAELPESSESFIPYKAEEGSLYPIDGGMIQTLSLNKNKTQVQTFSISGLEHLQYYLDEFDITKSKHIIFIEALACKGGCINGPCLGNKTSGLKDRLSIQDTFDKHDNLIKRIQSPQVHEKLQLSKKVSYSHFSDSQIGKALAEIGKVLPQDELNCGGCGYDTCRSFAESYLRGNAELEMCVSFMRKKALNKANAILRCMPSGVVIVDSSMRIIECNKRFAEIFGEENLEFWEVFSTLEGAYIDKIVPFAELFKLAIRTGEDLFRENLRVGNKLLHLTLFTIEPKKVIGGIIQDATVMEVKREEIANKANDILKKNLNTVQDIAKLLGEHMADTEILLRSIAKGFTTADENPIIVSTKGASKC